MENNAFCILIILFVFLTDAINQQRDNSIEMPLNTLTYTGVLGTIFKTTTTNKSRTHVLGSLTLSNADYSRGAFDGVPEELKNFVTSFNLATSVQIHKSKGSIRQITFTAGTQQGLTNNDFFAGNLKWWYEANFYCGVAFAFPFNLASAVSYLLATSPNTGGVANELEVAFSYTSNKILGQFGPSLEIAIPVSGSNGLLLQAGIDPSLSFFKESKLPLSISFPLRFGAGLWGYHVSGEDFTGYISTGVSSQLIVKAIQEEYGKWEIFIGMDILGRGDALSEVDLPADNGGNVIVSARLGFRFLY
ncbi:MAG TPA: hypothetical protein VHP36_08395 [Chitinispirillaceae bacterium]|nr:hypothetical protein [Chitinispirillaceae bacterium]